MRTRLVLLAALALLPAAACGEPAPAVTPLKPSVSSPPPAPVPPTPAVAEKLTARARRTTTGGASFTAPAGWSLTVRGNATILEAPEGDSHIAFVDVGVNGARDADAAVTAAWKAYKPDAKWPLKAKNELPDKDGWSSVVEYEYQTSPNEKRAVSASAMRAADTWTVAIFDAADATRGKRIGDIHLVFDRLLPKGFARESFAGKKANALDPTRVAALTAWVEKAMKELQVPGVSLGLVQGGKVVFSGGFGVRELGKKDKPDGDTLYMIASNTKPLSTLLLAKLVDEKKIQWDTPVTQLLPAFQLGDADTTKQVQVRHLVCACTGLPRQDLEMILEFKRLTPEGALHTLGTVQPTSKFGEMYQYSNLLAAAGGFVGGHVVRPTMELGAAYDDAMKTRVFEPLGMRSTTFDFGRALAANHAMPHALDVDAHVAKAPLAIDYMVVPVRPAGGAWSNVNDVLKYVTMELTGGTLPGGKRYIDRDVLLTRRAAQVSVGEDETYGMGLSVNTKYGVPVVDHGGDVVGFHSDLMWLPDHDVGAVVLTNGGLGGALRDIFVRKLLEVLFDGKPEADADVVARARAFLADHAAERKLLTVPADAAESAKLAKKYRNDALGEITTSTAGGVVIFDFGEWKSEVATRKNPDGTVSFVSTTPGAMGFELVVGANAGPKRTLVIRDSQHEYVFTEL